MLTVLTEGRGKLPVRARGALRRGRSLAAACQVLTYSEFTLFTNRGRNTADDGTALEQFLGLREDISRLALGTYFAEVLDTVCAEEVPDTPLLRLALNALYALSRGLYDQGHIKAVFETRLLLLSGLGPVTECCAGCGRTEPEDPVLLPRAGEVRCRACAAGRGTALPLDAASMAALRHISTAPARKEFSFSLTPRAAENLRHACESTLLAQLDRPFPSLTYYKKTLTS